MKRVLGHVASIVAAGVAVGAAAPACATNDESIFVSKVLSPPTNRQNGACIYTDDPAQAGLFEGTLDIAVRDNYFAVILVGNQLIPRGDPINTRAESSRVHLDGAVVKVSEPNGNVLGEFTSVATGFTDPQQNNTPDYGVVGVTVIDRPTRDKIATFVQDPLQTKLVVANIKAFGKSLGGTDVESGEFQFPIRVCNGCLISFATGDDPATPGVDCNLPLESSGGAGTVLPCVPGQDEVTPCQTCAAERDACKTR